MKSRISKWFTLRKYCILWLIQNWLTRISTNQMNQLKILCRYRNKNGSNHPISHWLLNRGEFKIQKTIFYFILEKVSRKFAESFAEWFGFVRTICHEYNNISTSINHSFFRSVTKKGATKRGATGVSWISASLTESKTLVKLQKVCTGTKIVSRN